MEMTTKDYKAYYKAWMYTPENEGNCAECPENRGFGDWGGNRPCGQQNCWVTAHCSHN